MATVYTLGLRREEPQVLVPEEYVIDECVTDVLTDHAPETLLPEEFVADVHGGKTIPDER